MTADPWALLREAYDILQDEGRSGGAWDCMDLANGIEAALAERQDSAKDVVKWQLTNSPIGTMHAYLDGVDLRVRWDGQDAAWDATRYGRCATEAEAKSAAIAAARGMR